MEKKPYHQITAHARCSSAETILPSAIIAGYLLASAGDTFLPFACPLPQLFAIVVEKFPRGEYGHPLASR
jgi:hypothetical protein